MKNAAILFAILAISMPCAAGTITVNWDGSGDYTTIQAGINAAVSGVDTVEVAEGTYYENINFNGKNIILTSIDPADPNVVRDTIIDGGGSGHVVEFAGTETSACVLTGFTIQNGNANGSYPHYFGGGIYGGYGGSYTHATISNCIVSDNTANAGGGLVCCDGAITNCTITGNSATFYGGGLYYCHGTITNCIIWGNSAVDTGDQLYDSSTPTYSCIQDWAIGGAGNINDNPDFVGGDDYHLLPDSPCIDGGTNSPPGGLPATDLDGNPRPIDGNNDGLSIADMGAYEGYPSTEPVIWLSDLNVDFIAEENRANPNNQTLTIHNAGGETINWTITEGYLDPQDPNNFIESDCPWLTVLPDSGSSTGEPNYVTLSVDIAGLTLGNYNCQLTVSDPCAMNSPQIVSVDLEIIGPIIDLSQTDFNFTADIGGPNPADQIVSISNIVGGTLDWTITENYPINQTDPNIFVDCPWLTVIPTSGSSTGEGDDVTLSVDIAGLTGGLYTCELIISDPCAMNNPQIVNIMLKISTTLYVPSQYPTIQSAIDAAVNGDTVVVADGIYTGDGNRNIKILHDGISVRSENGPGVTIIDCEDMARGFYIDANSVELEGFTITNGYSSIQYFGGGITVGAGNPLLISNCIITNNEAKYSGGGINASWSESPRILNCTITGNYARWHGGGISSGRSNISGCTITGNYARLVGGGLMYGGEVTNCTITGNSAGDDGGGLAYSAGPITNCTIASNSADIDGGGLHQCDGVIANCTITGNSAGDDGGGLTRCDGMIKNCIIWGNTAVDVGDQLYQSSVPTYSCIQDWGGGTGNISDDPLFVNTNPIDPNGLDLHLKSQAGRWIADYNYMDPNSTPADPNDDFWVTVPGNIWVTDAVTSPCIDAGEPGSDWTGELWPDGGRINMGAYGGTAEASMSPNPVGNAADFNKDDVVDYEDFSWFLDSWQREEVLLAEDINRNNFVDMLDLALFAQGWLWEQPFD